MDTGFLEFPDRLRCMWLDPVRDQDMSGIASVHRHMNHCAHMTAALRLHAEFSHQFFVTTGHFHAIDPGSHTVPADLLHICDAAVVDLAAIRFLQTLADRMA